MANHINHTFGYLRVGIVSPELRVADVSFNTREIRKNIQSLNAKGCGVILFPELCLTGYSCADLFYQQALQDAALAALHQIAEETRQEKLTVIVGLPLAFRGRLYNCAAVVSAGKIAGLVPKTYLANRCEYYETRWFTSGALLNNESLTLENQIIPIGADLLFTDGADCTFGVEICEDLWSVKPPSSDMALAGATLILNGSAGSELLGKADYRRELIKQQSARCLAAYCYAGAGLGESSTDVVFSGHCLAVENGVILRESNRFEFSSQSIIVDIDLQRLAHDRLMNDSFASTCAAKTYRQVAISRQSPQTDLYREITPHPFVPARETERAAHCQEIFDIQTGGLAKRLRHINTKTLVIGLSGGLDSTLAFLVACNAFDKLGLSRSGIHAINMPGFGETDRTRNNAEKLARLLGTSSACIPIRETVLAHFKDIAHPESQHDVTFENAQARERTQVLMDLANQKNGLALGTGDLSESALGWCTFNGDHMSMYHINVGVPKTLVRSITQWCAQTLYSGEITEVLLDICATPISPELLPPGEDHSTQQLTEEIIGPYELHDFFLFYLCRHHFRPGKIFFLARQAFGSRYQPEEILRWMAVFYRRFFSQQFKRSSMPDGPKVGSVALSPRGDWRMPSDAEGHVWLEEVEQLIQGSFSNKKC